MGYWRVLSSGDAATKTCAGIWEAIISGQIKTGLKRVAEADLRLHTRASSAPGLSRARILLFPPKTLEVMDATASRAWTASGGGCVRPSAVILPGDLLPQKPCEIWKDPRRPSPWHFQLRECCTASPGDWGSHSGQHSWLCSFWAA